MSLKKLKNPKDARASYSYKNSLGTQRIHLRFSDDEKAIDLLIANKLEIQALALFEQLIRVGNAWYN